MPKLSVIIPVHNTAPYLKRCMDSVLGQSMEDIEVILSENLSSDGSEKMCDMYAEADHRVKVLHLDQSGLSYARNKALETVSADYVGFVDSDDYIDLHMFEDMYAEAERYGADIVSCNYMLVNDGVADHRYEDDGKIAAMTTADMVSAIIEDRITSSACVRIFRKSLFDTLRFPEGVFFEDHAVIYKLVATARVCIHMNVPYYYYVQRGGSICHTISPLKRYHFFLADYGRIGFVRSTHLFSEEIKKCLIRKIADECVHHFKDFIMLGGADSEKDKTMEMRNMLINLIQDGRDCLSPYARKKIVEMKFFWHIFIYCRKRKAASFKRTR